ncbi:amidohydrolase [Paractinoplanes deccanensis]|uniref:Amidohydrolase n=1 Tax=Paractinoplanes deccanensis TaxID=113561 RepID=A0ABQ3XZ56_9ACTN|nr:amidohydrolase [Actinoplanes deccanensis]GID73021.1 amidohydrolase [Actinoplanes deccanensis]
MTSADWIFHGGAIHTMAGTTAEAVAVRDGVIVATGDVRALQGPGTEVVNLDGGALLPGFQDAHVHPVPAGLQLTGCDLAEVHSLGEYRALIAAHRTDGEWVLGSGWYGDVFPGGFPDRHELDRLVPDRPAAFMSHDAHGVWANSAALARAGIDRHTPDPHAGVIHRDADGEPTGMLGDAAGDLVMRLVPEPGRAAREQALRTAQAHLHGAGVTGWQDAAIGAVLGGPDPYDIYRSAEDAGWLTAKVTGALWWDRDAGLEQIERHLARRAETAGGRFRTTAIKIMQDGVCENLTAAVLSPYTNVPHTHGLSFLEPSALAEIVKRLGAERFDLHLHAVGDRAVRECLDALEGSDRAWDHRHQLAHLDLIHPVDVPRLAAMRVIANIQPLWARHDPVLVETKLPYLTRKQRENHFAFGSLAAAGAALAMGSDWPVSSPDPLWGIHTAVNRTAPAADPHAQDVRAQTEPLLASERLVVEAALAAYTIGAARACRRDDTTGSIEVGKAADLVVLDADPMAVPASALSAIRVRSTFADGIPVHTLT